MFSSGTAPFNKSSTSAADDGIINRTGDRPGRRSTNPFASWMDPVDLDLEPFNDPTPRSQHYHHKQQSTTRPSTLPHPLFPASSPSLSSPPAVAITHDNSEPHHLKQRQSYISIPSALHMSTSPTPNDGDISPSSNSYILSSSSGGSSTSHSYTPYQPPPIRQDSSGLSPQSNLAFRDGRLLDPEPVSPSTSTLVGSPMTPNRNGRRPFSWLGSSNDHQYSLSDITDSPDDIVRSSKGGHMASTYRLSKYKLSPNCKDDQEITSSVGPASAARTLGYHTQICSGGTSQNSQQFSQHAQQQSGLPGWESHVSVLMDEISLESFVPSDTPPKKNLREGIYNKRDINGRTSPASDFGQSSNTSMVTLLGQGNTTTANSSSTTLFGGFMSKSKSHNSFKRLNDPREDMGLQHQIITISASGKSYTQRPKDKKFGRKGGNGNGNGGVNAERKSLFSNERTLVHWIKFGILLGTMALTLCNFGRKGSLAFHIGSSLLLAAMTTLGYAVLTFHYRDRSLSRRLKVAMAKKRAKCNKNGNTEAVDPSLQATKDICYYDRTGPTVVCCVLIFACSINFYLSMAYGPMMNTGGGLSYFHVNEF